MVLFIPCCKERESVHVSRVVILGAGLTGLSVAYHLEKKNITDYCIFEQHDRPGGLLRSFKQDGFTFDFTGHLLHSNDPYFSSFLQQVVGMDILRSVERRAAIYSHATYTDYPFQMNLRNLPFEIMYECISGFIDRNQTNNHPKTFYDWVIRYFGAGFGKHFFFPYNRKLLAYDIKKITPSWTGRFVPQTSLRDILQGSLQHAISNVGYNSTFLYPQQGGIETVIHRLLEQLQNTVQAHYQADRIDMKTKTVFFTNGHKEHYDVLISTMPLDRLLRKINEPSSSSMALAEKKLRCNAVVNINLGVDREMINDHHWIYFPEKQYSFYRLGFWHNINAASVKLGCSGLYSEVSYLPDRTTKTANPVKTDLVIKQVLDFLKLERKNIVTEKILYLDHAYVIYDQWREKNLSALLTSLKEEGIFSVGRFGAWKYSSMQEALLDGRAVADEIIALASQVQPAVVVESPRNSVDNQIKKEYL